MKILEIFPWSIWDNYLSSSVNSDFNSILHQKWIKYCNSYFITNKDNKISIRNFITSNTENGIIYMRKLYDRLYNNNISYSESSDKKIFRQELEKSVYVNLKNIFYLQLKKPWINELWIVWNYNNSSRIFQQFFEEISDIIGNNETVRIDFSYWYTNYSKLWKNIVFWWKLFLINNEIEKEELFWSFTDKLEFIKFSLKVSSNSKRFNEIIKILRKNLEVYSNKFNSYKINKKNWSFLNLKNKLQIDTLISHSLNIPIYNNFSINNKSRIIEYWSETTNNSLIKGNNKWYDIILWKVYKNNVIENKELLILDDTILKNKHSIVIWQSWSGKSYTLAPIIAQRVIKSNKEFDVYNKYWDKIIVLDPHSSFWTNITDIIKKYKAFDNNCNIKKILYSKNKEDWFSYKKLVFNPLFIKNLNYFLNNNEKFNEILNYHSDSILASIKGFYSEWDFGARNQNLLKNFVSFFIVINVLKYKRYLELKNKENITENEKEELLSNSIMLSIWDIVDILVWILQNWTLESNIFDYLKILLNNSNKVLSNLWEKFKKDIEYIVTITKKEKNYIESTINKLEIFRNSLYKTFGACSLINYTLDLQDLFLKNSNNTEFISFDFWDYSSKEKSIISNFIMTYSYYFWVSRDLFNEKLWEIYIYIDEVNSILSSQNSVENLKNLFYEIRKYKINLNLFYQNSKQKGFDDLYSNTGYVITFSNSWEEVDYIINDFNSWTKQIINSNDIINLSRWVFYILLKLNDKNITLYCQWLDFNNKRDFNNIIS